MRVVACNRLAQRGQAQRRRVLGGAAPQGVEQLNARVYANLFLTPDSDPWLGLAPADTFTGLENNGLVQAKH